MVVLREGSLLLLMAVVTVAIVTIETGHLSSGLSVAMFAAPLKWLVASAHHRLFARLEHAS